MRANPRNAANSGSMSALARSHRCKHLETSYHDQWIEETWAILRIVFALFLAFLAFTPVRVECARQHDHASGQPDRMGKVQFETSCSPEVQEEFDLAVATLHSFGYRKSARLFADVLIKDSKCSMAEWGIAMSHYRELWIHRRRTM